MTLSPPASQLGSRFASFTAATLVAVGVVLVPPWRATAIRTTTTRYGGEASATPMTLTDTVQWTLSWAPLYRRPRAPFTAAQWRAAEERALAGEGVARATLLPIVSRFERRYDVPDVLRAAGTAWRDSVLATAGMPSISSYDVVFAIDDARLATRLALLLLAAYLIDRRQRRRAG